MRLWMSVCKTLLPDVMVAEVHQQTVPCITMIAAMYEFSGPTFDSLCKN